MKPTQLTHNELVARAVRWLRSQDHRAVLAEPTAVSHHEIPDAIGWTDDGRSTMVECKTSRADFLKDREKLIRAKDEEHQLGNERWFMTPRRLLMRDEIPTGWGLVEVTDKKAFVVKPATRHRKKDQRLEMILLATCLGRLQGDRWAEAFGVPEAYVEGRHWAQIVIKNTDGLEVGGVDEESEVDLQCLGENLKFRKQAVVENIRRRAASIDALLFQRKRDILANSRIPDLLSVAATLRAITQRLLECSTREINEGGSGSIPCSPAYHP